MHSSDTFIDKLPVGLISPSELCCKRSLSMTAESELFLERTGDFALPVDRHDDKLSIDHVLALVLFNFELSESKESQEFVLKIGLAE